MSGGTQLDNWLNGAGIPALLPLLKAYGVTDTTLCELQFSDYDAMGIFEPPDRQKLFKLIQNVKRIANNNNINNNNAPQQQRRMTQPPQNQYAGVNTVAPTPVAATPAAAAVAVNASALSSIKRRSMALQNNAVAPPNQLIPPPVTQTSAPVAPAAVPSATDDSLIDDELDVDDEFDDDETSNGAVAAATTDGDDSNDESSKIRVAVRKRPINSKEKGRGENDIASVNSAVSSVTISEAKVKVDLTRFVESHKFLFDEVFDENATNEIIYHSMAKPLVEFALNKGRATCFAYGQTGSGKTFTMMGPGDGAASSQPGLYAMAAKDIFKLIGTTAAYSDLQVWVSFFEIYGGKLYDLLNDRKKLICREDSQKVVNVVGIIEKRCHSVNELLDLISAGNSVRSTGSTGANIDSSRSHAILQIAVKRIVKKPPAKPKLKIVGKFSFIDLAGSERAADTSNNDRRTRLEGAEINKSLLALKECIRALDQNGKHLPFRGSQLTQVLKDSFVGNSRTIMIANISPNSQSCEHTLNTLRYADRVKELKGSHNKNGKKNPAAIDAYMPHQSSKPNTTRRPGAVSRDTSPPESPPRDVSPPPTTRPQNTNSAVKNSIKAPSGHSYSHSQPPALSMPQQQQQHHQQQQQQQQAQQPSAQQQSSHHQQQQQPNPKFSPPQYPVEDLQDDDLLSGGNSLEPFDLELQSTHSDLCSAILLEEEEIVDLHRCAIDASMRVVRDEMDLLKRHESRQLNVDEYADRLDDLLVKKIADITTLRNQLATFKSHLTEEARLSQTIAAQQRKPPTMTPASTRPTSRH